MAIYNVGLAHGGDRWTGNTIKCALLTAGYTIDVDHEDYADISGSESAATGYTTTGHAVTGRSVSVDNTNDVSYLIADDVAFGALNSGSVRYAVLYDSTDDVLIRVIDFGTTRTLNGGTVTLRFTNNRVRTLTT